MSDPEPAEAYLIQLVPDLPLHWQGASDVEIARIQQFVERPLPDFYKWFLMRMGRSMGPLGFPTLDFSAQTIIRCYEKGLFEPQTSSLVIAYESDEVAQLHLVYDLDRPARGDAFTFDSYDGADEFAACTETLREMLVWNQSITFGVDKKPERCRGIISALGGEVFEELDPCMSRLGFAQPIPCGAFCRIYHSGDAIMSCRVEPSSEAPMNRVFRLGASSQQLLRSILGTIAAQTPLDVEVKKWATGTERLS